MDLSHLLSGASPAPLYQPSWATPVDHVLPTVSDFPGSTLSPPRWIFPPVHESPPPQLSQCRPPTLSPQPVDAASPLPSPQADFSSLPAPGLTPATSIVQRTSAKPSSTVPLKEGFIDTGGATTFATRNPLKDIQPPRFRLRESQSDAAKLGRAEKKLKRDGKADDLREGVDRIIKSRDAAIKDLALEIDMTEKAIRTLINGETHYVKHRKPSMYNALVHKAKSEMNDDLPPCERYKLKEIQDTVRAGMDTDAFSEEYKGEALQELEEFRLNKTMGSRSSNMAAYADARATTAAVTQEIVGLGQRTGITGLAIFAKGHIHDDFIDGVAEFNGSASFFTEVLNIQPEDICSKFQQWVCNRKFSDELDKPDNLQTAQNQCAISIRKGLCMITNNTSLGMNYINYRTSIVQKHHVELLGWPVDIPFANPHQITTVAVARKLQQALSLGTCKWVTMTRQRRKDHAAALELDIEGGKMVGKKRKSRSDKGKKRKRLAAAVEEEAEEEESNNDDEEGDHGDEGEDDEAPPPPMKKKSAMATTTKTRNGAANNSKPGTASKAKAARAATKAKRVAKTLPPAAEKSKEFLNSEDDVSDC